MAYLSYIPAWYQALKKEYTWQGPKAPKEKVLYLTFDDGPIPGVTPWVIDQLASYQAKATFFCIGDNARKHSAILEQLIQAGHAIGNHTYHHLNGAKTNTERYLEDYDRCAKLVPSKLFRPPYGRIQKEQARAIRRAGSKIIMWDSLAGDWDAKRQEQDCFSAIEKNARSGSIIVFHDSIKAWPRLSKALPRVLAHYHKLGYTFKSLSPDVL